MIDEEALTAAHLAVENVLVDLRDSRIGVVGPGNGFVIKEYDGTPSSVMRLGTREGLRIAIEAYLQFHQEKIVNREDIMRFSNINFPDGIAVVNELIKYSTNECNCLVILGIRYDKMEKCELIYPCHKHPQLRDGMVAASDKSHFMYNKTTEEVVEWALKGGE